MAWIRNTGERAERRPADTAWLILSSVGVAVAGLSAQSQSSLDLNLFQTVNGLPDGIQGLSEALAAVGSIWAVGVIALGLLALGQQQVAWRAALAGAAAWGIAEVLHEILPAHAVAGSDIHIRLGDSPAFPSITMAVATAVAVVIAPYAVRPLRRLFLLLLLVVALATMYLGGAYPSDVFGGLLLGVAAASAVLVAFGSPAGRPTKEEVREGLHDLGYDVSDLSYDDAKAVGAVVMDASLASGAGVRVDAFGRDQRDARFASKAWHWAMYREPSRSVFGSRLQQVEHIGYTLMLADRAGVRAPKLLKTGIGGPETAMVVTTPAPGAPLSQLAPEQVTDDVLRSIWANLGQLHRAGISHGNLDSQRILVDGDGSTAFDDFGESDVTGQQYWFDRDDAAVLVETALVIGADRAVAAARGSLGKDRLAEVIPMVQPAALPATTGRATKHLAKVLKDLRSRMASAAGVDDPPPLKIQRLSLVSIGMLLGILIALSLAVSSVSGIDFDSVKGEFESATWGWAVAALCLYPVIPTAWGTALRGCVVTDLPLVPTVVTQSACSFLNLVTPNGIGGTALQVAYLHKRGVPVASAGSAMVLSTGVGGMIQLLLFLGAAAMTSTQIDIGSGGTGSFWIIALVAAAVGIVLGVPKIRGKVLPAVKRAASDIWSVLRNPRKGMQLVAGNLAGNLIYPVLLGLCLMAFGHSLSLTELIVVQIGAGMLGNVAPVPGGVGVQEAALMAGLTSFGIPTAPALATVLVFRGITFLLPAFIGFFTLQWIRKQGYA